MITLNYVKVILEKVSFDAKLFEKELKKAIKTLLSDEVSELQAWCYDKFGKIYNQVIEKCFNRLRRKMNVLAQ
ncbi:MULTISPECIES: hypothetical protein [Arcicella]|uniref:Transposase n=1 Tax=Arcicella aquatica TaxID=217141 RepID=A0ABU5QM18_9BACT|nr:MULTISPECIES: hypothetical protein [Arcicella]MDR6561248.1 hypothetical protein [Arcicella sp. BE51]MDR6811132.1 hypothetical protein [Arcicella sp. BE140]MDR6822482.1 hypothetical protein [Arcicella sp. BE139]MEA5258117.1 hypothetical protein [Arcicella aquatica]